MNEATVIHWLLQRRRSDCWLSLATALIALALGGIVLLLTFWFGYLLVLLTEQAIDAIAGLVANAHVKFSQPTRLIGAGCFLVLLFVGNARTSREELDELPKARYLSPMFTMRAGVVGGLLVLLSYPGASSRFLASIFFSGPRLIVGAWRLVAASFRSSRMDVSACSAVLNLLLERGKAVTYEDLENSGLQDGLAQLRGLDGVVFLEKGVSLTSDLRQEISRYGR